VQSSGSSSQLCLISHAGGKPGVEQERMSRNMLRESANQTPDEPPVLPHVDVDTNFSVEIIDSCVDSQLAGSQLANWDSRTLPDHLSHSSGPSNPKTPESSADDDQGGVNPPIPRSLNPLGDVPEYNKLGMDKILIA